MKLCKFITDRYMEAGIYSIYYGNKGASSSVSDAGSYVIIINLLDYIYKIFLVFILKLN
jgi:hypothetical protein